MKCNTTVTKLPPTFDPVELTITFETLKELRTFFAVFNHADVTESFGPDVDFAGKIRQSLRSACLLAEDYTTFKAVAKAIVNGRREAGE